MPFKKAERPKKLFVFIADQIMEAIQNEEFQPGDMLPSERSLAEKFAVSRPIIREAISSLQLLGIVQTYTGRGTIVLRKPPVDKSQQLWFLENEESPLQVLEARMIVEPGSAKLAAERRDSTSITRMEKLLGEMEQSLDNLSRYSSLDMQFHLEVAIASQNAVIQQFVESVIKYGNQNLGRRIREGTHHLGRSLANQYVGHHRLLFKAIVAKDGDKADEAMRVHLTSAYKNWFVSEKD